MNRRPRVFLVQEDPNKNVLQALDFGDIVPVLEPGDQITVAAGPWVKKIRRAMADFHDGDYVLAIGDPCAIGIACAVAAERAGGVFTMLKWDRQERRYYPVRADLTGDLNTV